MQQTYFVLPLSPKVGLLEWVPTCDTMHALVKEARNNVNLNFELTLLNPGPSYDNLTHLQVDWRRLSCN